MSDFTVYKIRVFSNGRGYESLWPYIIVRLYDGIPKITKKLFTKYKIKTEPGYVLSATDYFIIKLKTKDDYTKLLFYYAELIEKMGRRHYYPDIIDKFIEKHPELFFMVYNYFDVLDEKITEKLLKTPTFYTQIPNPNVMDELIVVSQGKQYLDLIKKPSKHTLNYINYPEYPKWMPNGMRITDFIALGSGNKHIV